MFEKVSSNGIQFDLLSNFYKLVIKESLEKRKHTLKTVEIETFRQTKTLSTLYKSIVFDSIDSIQTKAHRNYNSCYMWRIVEFTATGGRGKEMILYTVAN